MLEIFKFYKDTRYNNNGHLWEVSNMGRVKRDGKIFIPTVERKGYSCFAGEFTHRAIWKAFYGDIPEGMVIDHIDTDPINNRIDNLRLVTPKENSNNPLTIQHRKETILKRKKA